MQNPFRNISISCGKFHNNCLSILSSSISAVTDRCVFILEGNIGLRYLNFSKVIYLNLTIKRYTSHRENLRHLEPMTRDVHYIFSPQNQINPISRKLFERVTDESQVVFNFSNTWNNQINWPYSGGFSRYV